MFEGFDEEVWILFIEEDLKFDLKIMDKVEDVGIGFGNECIGLN